MLIIGTGSCTDASWLSGDCPQYCKDDTSTVFGDMRECPGQVGVWTCGLDPSNCTNSFSIPSGYLDDNRDTTLSAIVALPAPYTSSSLGTDPATVTKTVLATVTASTSAMSSPSFKNDNATTIGLGTGLGVGLPLLLALCVSLWFLHRAQKRIKVLGTGNNSPRIEIQNQGDSTKWPLSHEIDGRYVYEVPAAKS